MRESSSRRRVKSSAVSNPLIAIFLKVHRQPSHEVARTVVALNAGRGAISPCKVETGMVKLIFAEDRHVPVHEIFRTGQKTHSDFTKITALPIYVGRSGKEYRRTDSGIDL